MASASVAMWRKDWYLDLRDGQSAGLKRDAIQLRRILRCDQRSVWAMRQRCLARSGLAMLPLLRIVDHMADMLSATRCRLVTPSYAAVLAAISMAASSAPCYVLTHGGNDHMRMPRQAVHKAAVHPPSSKAASTNQDSARSVSAGSACQGDTFPWGGPGHGTLR